VTKEGLTGRTNNSRLIPKGWKLVKLEDVVIPYRGYWGKETPSVDSREVIVLGVGNITNDGRINLEGVARRHLSPKENDAIAREGDLLVVKSSGSASNIRSGKTGLCSKEYDEKIACSNFMIRLAVKPDQANPYLLWLMLNSEQAKSFIRIIAGSTTYPNIKWSLYKDFSFPLPPLPEQKRIAAMLNDQLAAVDQARAAAEAQLKAAKVLPAAYLREEFEGLEAQKWVKMKIQDCCQLLPSKSIATDGDTKVDVVTTACLTESGFQLDGIKRGRMWSRDAAECIIQPEEILIARSNTPELVGRVAMYPGGHQEIVAADLTIRLMAGENVGSAFLSFYLSYLYLSGYWKTRAGGASGSMKKITRAQILGEKVPLPPLDEQRRIAASIGEKMNIAHRARKVLEVHLNKINKLPAVLLRQAFNGYI
jgi:type I restriction enzyme, S subunit